MINRTKIKNSIYDILDEDPKKIQEYINTEAEKTTEQKEKEKEKRNKKSNITDVNLQNNIDNQEDNPYNRIVIHTEKDNIVHNYFHDFEMYWDAGDPLSSAILKLPKTNEDNTKYWITYTGDVVIYLGNEINAEMKKSQDGQSQETYLSLKGMKPIFKGEIGRIKEYNKELEIHIDSIGKRFKQKIPEEFRQSFINNQNVRDAFQAICEFLGVKYICPPPQASDDVETDGTENSVDDSTQQQVALGADAVNKAENQNQNSNTTNDVKQQTQNLLNNSKSGITLQGIQLTGTSQTGQNDESNNTDQNTNMDVNANTQSDVQNGYADISFDANGNITHGSVGIETSPDMEDTLLALEEHPLDKYLEDTTFVATDVKRFLNGEMFDTVHNFVMNYGAITIQPKSSSSSDMSTIGTNGTTNSTDDTNSTSDTNDKMGGNIGGQVTINKMGGSIGGSVSVKGQTSSSNSSSKKKTLTQAYVNSLTPAKAKELAKQTNVYDAVTIKRLRRRGIGLFW